MAMLPVGEHNRGFTLLELLLVLVLLGFSSLIVLPSIERGLRGLGVRRSAIQLAATARELHRQALSEGTLRRLIFDPEENSYQPWPGEKIALSSGVRITRIQGGEPMAEGATAFVFFPNGSALGGEVEIAGSRGSGYIVRFAPLSGRVVVLRRGRA